MSEKPLISIIVPIYNTEKYLSKCIDSIINQTYSNLEIILVNDGSTDNCYQICNEYAMKDKRIKVINKENGGQAESRNMALDVAKGEYIGFVDSDDYIDMHMYDKLYDVIIKYKCDIAICGRYNVIAGELSEQFSCSETVIFDSVEALRKLLIYDNLDSSPCDKLFNRDLLKDIRFPSGYICEDVDLIFRAIDKAKRIVHCGEPLYYYLQRVGSTSNSSFKERTMGLKIHHNTVYDFIISKYPFLKLEAEYFYFSRVVILYSIMVKSGYSGIHKKNTYREINKNFWKILTSRYFSNFDKFFAAVIVFKIYDLRYIIRKV